MARIGAAAIAPQGVRRRNTKLLRIACESMKTCRPTCRLGCRNSNLIPTMAREFTKWQGRRWVRTGSAKV